MFCHDVHSAGTLPPPIRHLSHYDAKIVVQPIVLLTINRLFHHIFTIFITMYLFQLNFPLLTKFHSHKSDTTFPKVAT